ncbi:unnamed protein product [Owenia fusiformis]|uniref:G2/mitotic-specific cyclin-B3 n=1 Tax=Owenia fusiformis TaxID=6347 RepID=A0A8S4NGY1_OWEFU|nr:unnamed protein product [Owenia fusiformis]
MSKINTRRRGPLGGLETFGKNKVSSKPSTQIHIDEDAMVHKPLPVQKRVADRSSPSSKIPKKRAAFGDITNNSLKQAGLKPGQKPVLKKTIKKSTKTVTSSQESVTSSQENVTSQKSVTSSQEIIISSQEELPDIELSADVIDLPLSQESKGQSSQPHCKSPKSSSVDPVVVDVKQTHNVAKPNTNAQIEQLTDQLDFIDVDKEHMLDTNQVALYAHDIFQYYKQRELKFGIEPYLAKQSDLTQHMRSILVDWLVEVQENFELNHETLYLAVKLVDHYLEKKYVKRENLQLVGSSALFISCKFDERCPPCLDDFLYICDDAYNREELLEMERDILRVINFDLGIPLSYRFLRRYAKCGQVPIETLTLARYILELSLMEYQFVCQRDSKVAASALLLAMKMMKTHDWTPTLTHYTGYVAADIVPIARELNMMLANAPMKALKTIRSKYSHTIFSEVAKTPLINNATLSAPSPVVQNSQNPNSR